MKVTNRNQVSKYETRRMNDLQIPRPRLEIAQKRFLYVSAMVWNEIQHDIRNIEYTHLFKQKVKTYVLAQECKTYNDKPSPNMIS